MTCPWKHSRSQWISHENLKQWNGNEKWHVQNGVHTYTCKKMSKTVKKWEERKEEQKQSRWVMLWPSLFSLFSGRTAPWPWLCMCMVYTYTNTHTRHVRRWWVKWWKRGWGRKGRTKPKSKSECCFWRYCSIIFAPIVVAFWLAPLLCTVLNSYCALQK